MGKRAVPRMVCQWCFAVGSPLAPSGMITFRLTLKIIIINKNHEFLNLMTYHQLPNEHHQEERVWTQQKLTQLISHIHQTLNGMVVPTR